MDSIIEFFSNKLPIFYLIVAGLSFYIAKLFWNYLSKKEEEKKTWKRKVLYIIPVFCVAGLICLIYYFLTSPTFSFPENVTGILVLRIEGDDENNSLQHDWISTLNTKLSEDKLMSNIEVHAYNKKVNEDFGLMKAHQKAREFGEKTKALMVLWGIRIGEKKIHPRITIVDNKKFDLFLTGEQAMIAQIIGETNLPPELIDKPVSLAHFINGYDFYNQGNFSNAINCFEKSIHCDIEDSTLLNDITFYLASSFLLDSQGKKGVNRNLEKVIKNYTKINEYYKSTNDTIKFASTNNNLGIAFAVLDSGNRKQNLQMAVNAFEIASKIFSKEKFPLECVQSENNLNVATVEISRVEKNPNFENIINNFEAILHQDIEKNFSRLWAIIQNNLGIAYLNLRLDKNSENIRKAIAAFERSLKYYNKPNFPIHWAMISNNLGKAYINLPANKRNLYFSKAIDLFNEASTIFSKKKYPLYWSIVRSNIADTESLLSCAYEAWVKLYFRDQDTENSPNALFVDKNGNVYITGTDSYNIPNKGKWQKYSIYEKERYINDSDITTIKYAPDGSQLWIKHFHVNADSFLNFSPSDIVVNGEENVYIAGKFESYLDFGDFLQTFTIGLIVKYNRYGNKILDSYNQQIALFDNVFSSAGVQYDLILAIDNDDNIYMTGRCRPPVWHDIYTTAKYKNNFELIWNNNYDLLGPDWEWSTCSTIDDLGNVYIVAEYHPFWSKTNKDLSKRNHDSEDQFLLITLKYNREGKLQWEAKQAYQQRILNSDIPSIGIDHLGNCIISGTINDNFLIIKYNQFGKKLWERKYDGPDNLSDKMTGHVIDGLGNIYVAGSSEGLNTSSDYRVLKYDLHGNELWTTRYNGTGDSTDLLIDMAIDKLCNIYITGYSWAGSDFDIVTIVYDSTGAEKRKYRYESEEGANEYPVEIALDSQNNILITGYASLKGKSKYVIIKYNRIEEE